MDKRGNIYGPKYEPYLVYGFGCWQVPEELASLILFLKDKNIQSFLNIGTFNGLTFNLVSKYIKLFNKNAQCISIDPINHDPVQEHGLIYESKTSDAFARKPFDFVFIDGDHTYKCVAQDFINVGRYAKFCVFHDIKDKYIRAMPCGGVTKFWNEIKKQFKHHEFICTDNDVMGIGMLEIVNQ